MKQKYFVDLFAGCGGLSLGLENSGFRPAYVSEINRDAMETYLVNRDASNPLLREKHHGNDISQITRKRGGLESLACEIGTDYGISKGELDLVVGGPPCQGFSAIGHRRSFNVQKAELPYNHLYKDMAKAIKHLNPKCFLFENVGGMLSGKWSTGGTVGEIWSDVKKSFHMLDYDIGWELIRAKMYGVPQNRPRIIMIGLRKDISYERDATPNAHGLLPDHTDDYVDPKDLISDLVDPDYLAKKSTDTYLKDPRTKVQKELRGKLRKGHVLVDQEYSNHSKRIISKFTHMIRYNNTIPKRYQTKKFSQKAIPARWGSDGPNVTVASNPGDYVHYSQPRILTVREWARFQTFPDWYQFSGKRHTGGRKRAGDPDSGIWEREVPKYTQIGNAVPVKLAETIGRHLRKLIK